MSNVPTISRQSVEINIEIDKGSTKRVPLEFHSGLPTSLTGEKLPPLVDVTGLKGRLTIRGDDNGGDVVLLSDNAEGVEVGGVDGLITLVLTAAQTSSFTWSKATYAIELIEGNGDITPFVHGRMKLFDRL